MPSASRSRRVIQAMVERGRHQGQIKRDGADDACSISRRQGKFQSHLIGWSGRVDPDLNITPMLACGAAGNDAHYCNKDLDDILTQARAIGDPETRKAKYAQGDLDPAQGPADRLSLSFEVDFRALTPILRASRPIRTASSGSTASAARAENDLTADPTRRFISSAYRS